MDQKDPQGSNTEDVQMSESNCENVPNGTDAIGTVAEMVVTAPEDRTPADRTRSDRTRPDGTPSDRTPANVTPAIIDQIGIDSIAVEAVVMPQAIAAPVTAPPNVVAPIEQTADILKLDIDCFEELFDYLSLWQLFQLSSICKRFNQVAGYCYQETYPNINIVIDRVRESYYKFLTKHTKKNKITNKTDQLECYVEEIKKFRRFKEIEFRSFRLTYMKCIRKNDTIISRKVNKIKDVLSKLEFLDLNQCMIDGNLHDAILIICPNLKGLRLTFNKWNYLWRDTDNDWLLRKYPSLEHFEFLGTTERTRPISHLIIPFLNSNPTIRSFAVSADFIWKQEQKLLNSNVKLDDLAILIEKESQFDLAILCSLLNKLHERSFYERLKIYFKNNISQSSIDQLASLRRLVKLYIEYVIPNDIKIALSALKSLEEFRFRYSEQIGDLELFATLPNLKYISFDCTNFDDILMLVSRAVNLTKIRVGRLKYNSTKFSKKSLATLNTARQLLDGPSTVIIYVEESIFLQIKWTMKQEEFEFIKVRREESYDWNHDFRADRRVDQMSTHSSNIVPH